MILALRPHWHPRPSSKPAMVAAALATCGVGKLHRHCWPCASANVRCLRNLQKPIICDFSVVQGHCISIGDESKLSPAAAICSLQALPLNAPAKHQAMLPHPVTQQTYHLARACSFQT